MGQQTFNNGELYSSVRAKLNSNALDAELKEYSLGNPDEDGQILSSTSSGSRIWVDYTPVTPEELAKLALIEVTQTINLDALTTEIANKQNAPESFNITSSNVVTGVQGEEISHQVTSDMEVIWSMNDLTSTGYEIDRLDGTLIGLNPVAGQYTIQVFALNLQTGAIANQTITINTTV